MVSINFKNRLKQFKTKVPSLINEVLEEIENLNSNQEIKSFFFDLLRNGCVSGMIGKLIYYKDTNDFYDKYENEIEDLITEQMEMLGVKTRPLFIESLNGGAESMTQEKNLLSWFAFEETARFLATQISLEI